MGVQADLVIESRVGEIARARRWLAQYAQAVGFPEKEVGNLALALSEACANIIKHAYHGQPDRPIELHLSIDETKLALSIHDVGARFDVQAYQPPDLTEAHEGGYGVFIIRSLMDEVEYDTSDEQGTTLTLVKYRPGPSSYPGDRGRKGYTWASATCRLSYWPAARAPGWVQTCRRSSINFTARR
jgi:serine/threonine-protein kinase RsbW